MPRTKSVRKIFTPSDLDSRASGLNDAVAADQECAVKHTELANGLGHAVVEHIAFGIRISLERVEDHLLRLLEDTARITNDEQRADVASLSAVRAKLKSEREHTVKDSTLNVFINRGLLGGIEELVLCAHGHDHERVDERAIRAGEKDRVVAEFDHTLGERDDGGERDLAESIEFDVRGVDHPGRALAEAFDHGIVLGRASNENRLRRNGIQLRKRVGGDEDPRRVARLREGGRGFEQEASDSSWIGTVWHTAASGTLIGMNAVLVLIVLLIPSVARAAALATPWLYHPQGVPLEIVIDPMPATSECELVLMQDDGTVVDRSTVADATVDLRAVLPAIEELPAAAFVQLLIDGTPHGPALVVQPLLSRMVPLTEAAQSPSGYQYERVVGWRDENETDASPDDTSGDDVEDEAADEPRAAARVRSGYRVYRERDVILATDHGDIRVRLRPDAAPNTAWNFRQLVEGGFYRSIDFHRIVPLTGAGDPFVIQAGDPSGTGDGGPGYWVPIEPSTLPHDFGVLSMARAADPDSAGSQIFFCLSRAGTARLDGSYCSFGETIDGADVIRAIASAPLADVAAGRPETPPVIISASLVDASSRHPGTGRSDAPSTDSDAESDQPVRIPR